MIMGLPPSGEQERHVLEQAMVECRKRLDYFRGHGNELERDLAESDLNVMLERWNQLGGDR